jgi:spore coat polysaccharide biosynthesis protein SpsF
MTMPFAGNMNLLELMLTDFKQTAGEIPFVVATSVQRGDSAIVDVCRNLDVPYFRGPEQDVLERFILTAKQFGFDNIIRVCADNPFFDLGTTLGLLDVLTEMRCDYAGFSINGKPSIKTHLGLWGEAVTFKSLLKTSTLTVEPKYREHVTNYLYSNQPEFQITLIPAPYGFHNREDLRFTLDTEIDFKFQQQLYQMAGGIPNPERLIELLKITSENEQFRVTMREEIHRNSK